MSHAYIMDGIGTEIGSFGGAVLDAVKYVLPLADTDGRP
jgi:hypothetical protein